MELELEIELHVDIELNHSSRIHILNPFTFTNLPHGRIIKTSSLSGQSKDKVPHLPGAVNPDYSRKVREIVLTVQPSQVLIIFHNDGQP